MNRSHQVDDVEIKKFIQKSLEWLKKQLNIADKRLAKAIEQLTAGDQRKIEILDGQRNGPVAIATFLAELPELGELRPWQSRQRQAFHPSGL